MFNYDILFPFISDVLPNLLRPHFFLYLGPDTILPAASICGGLVGFVLIFWRYIFGMAKRAYLKLTKQDELFNEEAVAEGDTNKELLDA